MLRVVNHLDALSGLPNTIHGPGTPRGQAQVYVKDQWIGAPPAQLTRAGKACLTYAVVYHSLQLPALHCHPLALGFSALTQPAIESM